MGSKSGKKAWRETGFPFDPYSLPRLWEAEKATLWLLDKDTDERIQVFDCRHCPSKAYHTIFFVETYHKEEKTLLYEGWYTRSSSSAFNDFADKFYDIKPVRRIGRTPQAEALLGLPRSNDWTCEQALEALRQDRENRIQVYDCYRGLGTSGIILVTVEIKEEREVVFAAIRHIPSLDYSDEEIYNKRPVKRVLQREDQLALFELVPKEVWYHD